jgi:hypothetical protein
VHLPGSHIIATLRSYRRCQALASELAPVLLRGDLPDSAPIVERHVRESLALHKWAAFFKEELPLMAILFDPPFPAPNGYAWIFCAHYKHAKTGKLMVAQEYGRKAWCFLVRRRSA